MSEHLQNAPLLELIAEVRWEPKFASSSAHRPAGNAGPAYISAPSNQIEEFFMGFGARVHSVEYSNTERVIPAGFPYMAHQPVFRFRSSKESATTSLYQVGPGLFTANAVPPYDSWKEFRPVVAKGVDAMIAARSADERDTPFSAVNLRYIDAFGENLTSGRDIGRFLEEVFKIKISLPVALSEHLLAGQSAKPFVQFQIPMERGMLMSVGVGEGVANGRPAIMLDTSVATTLPIPPIAEAIMEAFEFAHKVIDKSFLMLIEPIRELMPSKAEKKNA
jgi:uncharacterized protein (TIGR04255 family)